MSDPVRLRDLPGDDGALARSLLRHAEPTRALSAADAARLQATVVKAAAAPASAGLLASAGPYVLAALATVGAVTAALSSRPEVHRAQPASPAPVLATPSAPAPAPVPAPVPAPAPAHAATTSTPDPPPPARPRRARTAAARPAPAAPVVERETPVAQEPTLSEELGVIRAARASLRTDPSGALRVLRDAERVMPGGQLRDEREALAIEALLGAGRAGEARARLDALERRAPNSPQGARLRALLRDAP